MDNLVATRIEPRPGPSIRLPAADIGVGIVERDRLAAETAIATIHAERAASEDEPAVRAVETLARELLGNRRHRRPAYGLPKVRDPSGYRRRSRLRAEIGFFKDAQPLRPQRNVSDTNGRRLPELVELLPSDLLDPQLVRQHLLVDRPDLDLLRTLVTEASSAYWSHRPYLSALLQVIDLGFRQYEVPPDPLAEANALAIGAARLREAEQMGTYALARRVEALVGPQHDLAIQTMGDSALVLRANHYLELAEEVLHQAGGALLARPPSDAKRAMVFSNVSTFAAIAANSLERPGAVERIERAHAQLGHLLDVLDRDPDDQLSHWRTVVLRRQVQLDLAVAIAKRERVRGRYRVVLPRTTAAWRADAAESAAQAEEGPWPMGWALQEMRLAIAQRDPEAFWSSRDNAADWHRRQPHYTNLVVDFNVLTAKATKLGWSDPNPTELATGQEDAMRLTRPDRIGVV
jgi:hypothetical protein